MERPFSPPPWLAFDGPFGMGGILAAHFDLGSEPCALDKAPYGANMAFRRCMFEKYGLFRTDLGPSPNRKTPRPNEDTEFGRRLLAAGERLRYEPSAIAYHPVPENRLSQEYFLNWWFDFGRALIREKGQGAPIRGLPRHYFGIPKMILVVLPSWTFQWICTLNQEDRFRMKCRVWNMAGQFAETFRIASGQIQNPPQNWLEKIANNADR